MSLGGKKNSISAHGTNDRHHLMKFAGEKVRGVEENENITLEKQEELEAEVRHG